MPVLFLNWGAFGPVGGLVTGPQTIDTGGVAVEVTLASASADNFAITTDVENFVGPDEPFNPNSSLKLFGAPSTDGSPVGDVITTTLDFSATDDAFGGSVENVSFRISDIDGAPVDDIEGGPGTPFEDIVAVRAFDAEGNAVPVSLFPGSGISVSGDTATGDGENFVYSPEASLLVNVAGPVSRVEIDYDNGDAGQNIVAITDVYFSTTDPVDTRDGIVSGTDDDDLIDIAYLGDPDTPPDQIDNEDAIIPGDDPNDDRVFAGDGNDTIIGGEGADTLFGEDDADTFIGGDPFEYVVGGEGGEDFDTLDLRGEGPTAVIYTTPDQENGLAFFQDAPGGVMRFEEIERVLFEEPSTPDGVVEGTFGDDVIDVFYTGDPDTPPDRVDNDDALLPGQVGDDDIIVAKTGNDTVIAAEGDDIIFAGEGDDSVAGGNGDDFVIGWRGDDLLEGDAGDDTMAGGDGNDTLDAGRGDDLVFGEDGDDTLTGNPGADTLIGGDGNDQIIGNDDDDVLVGGAGNDTISTGPGEDFAEGGDDRDTIIVVGQDNQFVDGSEGGDDVDTLIVFGNAEVEFDPDNDENGVVFYLDDADVRTGITTTFINIENIEIVDPPIDGVVEGGAGDDLIDAAYTGDPEGDEIDAFDSLENFLDEPIDSLVPSSFFEAPGGTPRGDNRDAVDAGAGDDTILSGDGDDIVDAGEGDDSVLGGLGFDDIFGNDGDDFIDGEEGTDKIFGGDGDDTLVGGLGDDTLIGGDGSDSIDGGLGNNFAEAGAGDDIIIGGASNDSLDGGADNDTVIGGGGEDTVIGSDGNDLLSGGTPGVTGTAAVGRTSDTIDGGAGDDTLDGSSGDDLMTGGAGADTMAGGSGADEMDGGADDDLIYGDREIDLTTGEVLEPDSDLEDALLLEPGFDTITGGAGNDTIDGGANADSIDGGDDRDVILVASAEEGDGDTVHGGSGGDDFDVLDLTGVGLGNFRLVDVTEDDDGPGVTPNGIDGTVEFLDASGAVTGSMTFTNIESVVPCFTPGTLIATPTGERLVEELREGDKIITRDNGLQEIRWIGQKELTGHFLTRKPHLRPILIQAGSLGRNLPENDMLVSPNHRLLMNNEKTAVYFEEREVFAAAKHLLDLDGVDEVGTLGVTYVHFMCDNHEVVLSNGAWSESFQPGNYTLTGMDDAQRQEILELFPELTSQEGLEAYTSARRALKKHEARLITQ